MWSMILLMSRSRLPVRWPSSDNLHSPEATIQRQHNNITTTSQRHDNITTQQHHNNNTILLKQAAGAVRAMRCNVIVAP